jgi:hypothetical protein
MDESSPSAARGRPTSLHPLPIRRPRRRHESLRPNLRASRGLIRQMHMPLPLPVSSQAHLLPLFWQVEFNRSSNPVINSILISRGSRRSLHDLRGPESSRSLLNRLLLSLLSDAEPRRHRGRSIHIVILEPTFDWGHGRARGRPRQLRQLQRDRWGQQGLLWQRPAHWRGSIATHLEESVHCGRSEGRGFELLHK